MLLVGAGHAHLEVLRQQILEPLPADLELISAGPHHHYSGMVPGYLYGAYRESQIAFDLAAIAARAGIPFRQSRATGLVAAERRLQLEDGSTLDYDFVSFNVGSRAAGTESEAISRHAVLVKPMSQAVRLRQRLQALATAPSPTSRGVAVVGGGAAGVEVACSARSLLGRGDTYPVTVVEAGEEILSGYSDRFRSLARGVLERKGIHLLTGRPVDAVTETSISLADGDRVPAALTVWLTGAAAWPIFGVSGLSTDRRGFLLTDLSLRSVDDERVFAVGDCGTMARYPKTPKAGVYAVRQGPVLANALRAALTDSPPPDYEPQPSFLSILNTADGRALLRYGERISWSRWAWWLKDRIDRRFMRRYQSLIP